MFFYVYFQLLSLPMLANKTSHTILTLSLLFYYNFFTRTHGRCTLIVVKQLANLDPSRSVFTATYEMLCISLEIRLAAAAFLQPGKVRYPQFSYTKTSIRRKTLIYRINRISKKLKSIYTPKIII